jgi:hypothetical protein
MPGVLRFQVDFNELVEPDLVLLSRADQREDETGRLVALVEGMSINVWEADLNERGEPDDLIASGVVVRNMTRGWAGHVKWACRIDERGIRHRSESG